MNGDVAAAIDRLTVAVWTLGAIIVAAALGHALIFDRPPATHPVEVHLHCEPSAEGQPCAIRDVP